MKVVLDVENTFTILEFPDEETGKIKKKTDMMPFRANNSLVSVGVKNIDTKKTTYRFFHHNDLKDRNLKKVKQYHKSIQDAVNGATLIIGHHLKHDIAWCRASNINLPANVKFWDTAIAEYVLAKGQVHIGFSLEDCANRHGLSAKKTDLTREYLDKDIGFEAMPIKIVHEYGCGDLNTTEELYYNQLERLQKPENWSLLATIEMMNEFMSVLSKWQSNGIKIDMVELDKVRAEYVAEQTLLLETLNKVAKEMLGDTPFNINSGEDKSVLIYSRRVINKEDWKKKFNIGLDEHSGKKLRRPKFTSAEFSRAVRELTTVEKRTRAIQCSACLGEGYFTPPLKSGLPGKARRICKTCQKLGVVYEPTGKVAGFKLLPLNVKDVGVNGFVTDADKLEYLLGETNDPKAREFLSGLVRLNQINTYLNTFVDGIKRAVHFSTLLLYTNFNQIVTATGRLSSTDPNFQNIPRAKTFPVKRAIVSRFPGGGIVEADYAQLEFRVAGDLSNDPQIYEDVINKVDIHAFTRDTLNAADKGNRDRQDAKPETFKPVYGGTYGTPVQMAYYKAFKLKYKGLTEWQEQTAEFVLRNGYYKLPTGRQYRWVGLSRNWDGRVNFFTQIVNYPVQGFATGDIVPLACILIDREFTKRGLRSVPFVTVHDSIAVDYHPDEREVVIKIVGECMLAVKQEMKKRYDYDFKLPLEVEIKAGKNWLDTQKVSVVSHVTLKKNEFFNDPIGELA
jgi:DNA polymerase I-like protein with 3'-5' exonuclease and polymerase domains